MNKGIKLRIYPNKEQKNLINQTFGCTRLVYNAGLDLRNKMHDAKYSSTSAMLTCLKKSDEFSFLKDVDSIALQQSLRDLDRAFVNFFQFRGRYPRFKSKKDNFQSYRTINQKGSIRFVGNKIKLPKVGLIKVRKSLDIDDASINHVTVEKVPSGKYFVVLNIEFEPIRLPVSNNQIGIDVGIKDFYSDSNGYIEQNPKYLEKSMRKLIREQRRLSRKVKGSNNSTKQRIKVAKVHEKISNQRNDYLHKLSSTLINENQVICVEDLNIKGMIRNHKLAMHIASASWSKFFELLTYKSDWYGRTLIKIPTIYPSSQTCSCCGYKNPIVKNLAVRNWECPNCNSIHDRDVNAAINILNKGLSLSA